MTMPARGNTDEYGHEETTMQRRIDSRREWLNEKCASGVLHKPKETGMTTKDITLDHIDAGCRAAIAARDTGTSPDGHGYDQTSWCGTACCIWGHAVLAAGLPIEAAESGPPDDWPHEHIARMLYCPTTTPEQVLSRSMLYGDCSNLSGDCTRLRGDCSGLRGDCSNLRGDCTRLRGDCSGLYGDCSGLTGDCSVLYGYCSGLYGDCSGLRGDCSGLTGDCSNLRGDCSGLSGNCKTLLKTAKE